MFFGAFTQSVLPTPIYPLLLLSCVPYKYFPDRKLFEKCPSKKASYKCMYLVEYGHMCFF
jgi:hypothetical protein